MKFGILIYIPRGPGICVAILRELWYDIAMILSGKEPCPMPDLDLTVLRFVQAHCHNALTDSVFPVITYLGEAGLIWIALALLMLALGRKRGWTATGWLVLISMLLGLLIGEVGIKNLVCRPRPFMEFAPGPELLIPPPSGWSFPSGHSCSSFAAATTIFMKDKRWGAAAFLLAGLIAFSRVFLFVHWPSDVAAGAVLGVLCAIVTRLVYKVMMKRRERGEE